MLGLSDASEDHKNSGETRVVKRACCRRRLAGAKAELRMDGKLLHFFMLSFKKAYEAEAFGRTRKCFTECKLSLRFKGQFCYVDVLEQGKTDPSPLARLRFFRDNAILLLVLKHVSCTIMNTRIGDILWQPKAKPR